MIEFNNNFQAASALRNLGAASQTTARAHERLSSGRRINRAADDAAGMSISKRLQAQFEALVQSTRNAQDGVSLANTAEGALSSLSANIQRIRELGLQAANGALSADDRAAIQTEVDQLVAEVDRVASTASFNGQKLLDGTLNASIQVGASGGSGDQLSVTLGATALDAAGLGLNIDLTTQAGAQSAVASADAALQQVNQARSTLGATTNRLNSVISNAQESAINIAQAESRIGDADFAQQVSARSQGQLLYQASLAALSRTNVAPGRILSLLR